MTSTWLSNDSAHDKTIFLAHVMFTIKNSLHKGNIKIDDNKYDLQLEAKFPPDSTAGPWIGCWRKVAISPLLTQISTLEYMAVVSFLIKIFRQQKF